MSTWVRRCCRTSPRARRARRPEDRAPRRAGGGTAAGASLRRRARSTLGVPSWAGAEARLWRPRPPPGATVGHRLRAAQHALDLLQEHVRFEVHAVAKFALADCALPARSSAPP